MAGITDVVPAWRRPETACGDGAVVMFAPVKILAFSDLHVDLEQADRLAERAGEADVVVGAGDFASVHEGLDEAIGRLSAIETPTVVVPGNNETADALREACAGWGAATVLHGESTEIDGVPFFGLGAGVPVTPWDWSFDLDEEAAAERLEGCPDDAVLVVHSPPRGHCDLSGAGDHLGSSAILEAIEAHSPRLAVCGHIHESWGAESRVGETQVINLGPEGRLIEV
jgi:Icc-related predicted phosphoesterase